MKTDDMKFLEITGVSLAEHLAIDEAILEELDEDPNRTEVLRVWEAADPSVVVGRASRIAEEVDISQCDRRQIPIFRRCSGGAAVMLGPGCLMYSVVLSLIRRPQLRSVDQAHRFVLQRVARAIRTAALGSSPEGRQADVHLQGTSDLTVGGCKVSGNSLRCKRRAILYHGTLLYRQPIAPVAESLLSLIPICLRMPPREPDYRAARDHRAFLTALDVDRDRLSEALVASWAANERQVDWPQKRVEVLVRDRYGRSDWNRLR